MPTLKFFGHIKIQGTLCDYYYIRSFQKTSFRQARVRRLLKALLWTAIFALLLPTPNNPDLSREIYIFFIKEGVREPPHLRNWKENLIYRNYFPYNSKPSHTSRTCRSETPCATPKKPFTKAEFSLTST